MLDLNVEFQEEYKRLDRLCKDYLSSTEGVSEYISQMELAPWNDRRYVSAWEDDYKQLKHVRWVRNQLAHEVGTLNSDICTEDDLDWVQSFYNGIMNGSDPFSIIRKAKDEERRRTAQQRKNEKQRQLEEQKTHYDQPKPKQSFWKRVTDGLKSLFR